MNSHFFKKSPLLQQDAFLFCILGGVKIGFRYSLISFSKINSILRDCLPAPNGNKDVPSFVDFPLYLGKEFNIDEDTIKRILMKYPNLTYYRSSNCTIEAAQMLEKGNVIAWYQDRSEFGPRALGNRSILADPRDKLVVNRLNLEIKKREAFRPFAPSVLLDKMYDYFCNFDNESSSMMFVANVREEMKPYLPAITHVDNTARLQTVTDQSNPKYYQLIKHFGELTGIYVVLNTSFNLNGMPIVESPEDAISCYAQSNLDALIIGDFIIK
jgi:carbamoyltransferase